MDHTPLSDKIKADVEKIEDKVESHRSDQHKQMDEAAKKVREYTEKVENDIREHFEKRNKEDHEAAMKARDEQPPVAEMEMVERQNAQIPGIFGDNQTAADIGKPAPSPNDVANAARAGGGYASAEDARQSAISTQGPSSDSLNVDAREKAATSEGGAPVAGPMDAAVNHPDWVDHNVAVGDSATGNAGTAPKMEDMVGGHTLGDKTAADVRKDEAKRSADQKLDDKK